MLPEPQSLHVVVVSPDVSLLHEVSWVLGIVGFKVHTTSDFDQDALWRRYSLADFIIVDGRNIADPTPAAFAHDSEDPTYQIFLYDAQKPSDFAAWYAAGAHDALRAPVSRGELLVRMRTGARYLEFERRLQAQSMRSAVPGMYSRRGFLGKLQKLATNDRPDSSQYVLLVTAIDWYAGIRRKNGATVSRGLASAAARSIKRACGESSVSAYLGDGRFATLLVGQTPAAVKNIAATIAKDFATRESHHESIPRPTLTHGVVPWSAGQSPDESLVAAIATLELAEQSGSDSIVLQGDYAEELATWREEIANGNPFANVVAQDIMEPFPALLELGADQTTIAAALHEAQVPLRTYVDAEGRLIGVSTDAAAAASEPQIGKASDQDAAALTMPTTVECGANFAEIYEAFSTGGCASLVVTAGEQPVGYLTCEGFLSIIEPIHRDSFSQANASSENLAYLIVPSTTPDPESAVAAV